MANEYRVGVIGSTGRGNYGHGLDTVWRELPKTKPQDIRFGKAGTFAVASP